ncbi:MAG TPA: hypothetical protein VJN63_08300 [Thermoplasmata archaeon]|nr:hypothetical protein [Thermoplasmata archaeon]
MPVATVRAMTFAQFASQDLAGRPLLAFKQPTGTEVVVLVMEIEGSYELWEISA